MQKRCFFEYLRDNTMGDFEKNRLSELLKIHAKQFRVLYVEDDETVRTLLEGKLNRLFKEVVTATNGEEGVQKFIQCHPDLIITDITMPIMNGLEMIRAIRESDSDLPVVVTTAHNDEEFFLESFELGISRYVLKPVVTEKLHSALWSIVKQLVQKHKADDYDRKLLEEKINENTYRTVDMIANLYPGPTLVMEYEQPLYVNTAFMDLYADKAMDVYNGAKVFDCIFEQREGYLNSVEQYNDKGVNKVSIATESGRRKIYLLTRTLNKLADKQVIIYTFDDITSLEYQKLKTQAHLDVLNDMIVLKTKSVSVCTPKEEVPDYIANVDKTGLLLNVEKSLISANDYVQGLSSDGDDIIKELGDMEDEIRYVSQKLGLHYSREGVENIVVCLNEFASKISMLFEFETLVLALRHLAKTIHDDISSLTNENAKVVINCMEALMDDFKMWREAIFYEKTSHDIHEFDPKLLSACIEAGFMINHKFSDIQVNGELELF